MGPILSIHEYSVRDQRVFDPVGADGPGQELGRGGADGSEEVGPTLGADGAEEAYGGAADRVVPFCGAGAGRDGWGKGVEGEVGG